MQGKETRGGNQGEKRVKSMYLFKKKFYSFAWFRQTMCIVMITKEGSTKIVNFMTPGAKVRDHVRDVVIMHFFENLQHK